MPQPYWSPQWKNRFDKVLNFNREIGGGTIAANLAPKAEDVTAYVDEVMAAYAGASDDGKLGIIAREYFLAAFGNGFEAYNLYRRTGHPKDIQLPLSDRAGPFIRTFEYPADMANLNASAKAKGKTTVKVFWDTEADDFLK